MKRIYCQIALDERRKIERWRQAGVSVDVIAEKLGRHRSTFFREIAQNKFEDREMPDLTGYFCVRANHRAKERRSRCRKLVRHPKLRASTIERIKHGWSPEQVAGRLAYEPSGVRVCHETIYRFAYSADGQEIKLWRYLPESRARRRPRHVRRRHGRRFSPELSILHRPDIVRGRKQLGHWECDLIQFRKKFGKANVTSLVERLSRFTMLLRNNDRQSRSIMEGLINVLGPFPMSPAAPLPSTAAPSSPTSLICKPGSALSHGSAIRRHHGRKAPSKTPIAERGVGYHGTPILCRSMTGILTRFAPTSTQRRANASASGRRRKCSGKSCWPPIGEAATLL